MLNLILPINIKIIRMFFDQLELTIFLEISKLVLHKKVNEIKQDKKVFGK
jgi:hypothetical protein